MAALDGVRRALKPDGRLVAAVLVAPERASYWTWPRRLLQRYRALPPVDAAAPGPFRYADPERLRRDVEAAGLTIVHAEELELHVMEAATDDDLVAWVRAFGLTRLLNGLPDEAQRAWEADLLREAEPLRRDGRVQLGAVTRIVVATAARPVTGGWKACRTHLCSDSLHQLLRPFGHPHGAAWTGAAATRFRG